MKHFVYSRKKLGIKMTICLFLLTLLLCSCGNESTRSAAGQVALDYYELIAHQDPSPLIALGMPEDTASSILESMKTSLLSQVQNQLSMDGKVAIEEETATEIVDVYIDSLQKLSATSEKKQTEKGYIVTLTTNYIDYPAIDRAAIDAALTEIDISTYNDQTEYLSELTTSYISHLLEGYKKAAPSTQTVSHDFLFTNQNGLYLPENYSDFTTSLFLMLTHQEAT